MVPLAFLAPQPVSLNRSVRRGRTLCCAQRPAERPLVQRPRPHVRILRLINNVNIPSALVATAGVLFSNAIANPLVNPIIRPATAKELRYDGRQELDSREKAMSLALTAGTFAVLSVVAWKQNRVDDEVENLRIKDEVERLEKLRAEFVDVEEDEETMDDEDLLASLRERIGEDADGESEGESEEGQEGEGEGGKGTAVMEDDEDGSTTDSVDMLNRMWEATDDDSKKDKKQ